MRYRTMTAAFATAGVLLAALPASAGTPVLDGKKTKVLHFTDTIATPQDNDSDTSSSSHRTLCKAPRCTKFVFVYKPAKGVKKAPFSVRIAWTYPIEDYDLYVVEDNAGTVAKCGGGVGTSELAIVTDLNPGRKCTRS